MPAYNYRCDKCGHEYELRHGMLVEPDENCPKCGHDKATKLIFPTPALFKGGGFPGNDMKDKT